LRAWKGGAAIEILRRVSRGRKRGGPAPSRLRRSGVRPAGVEGVAERRELPSAASRQRGSRLLLAVQFCSATNSLTQ